MIETRRTCSLRLAGALLSMGCLMEKSEQVGNGRVVFILGIPEGLEDAADEARKLCHDGGYGLKVDVGAYEEARNKLRDELDRHNGGSDHGRRRT